MSVSDSSGRTREPSHVPSGGGLSLGGAGGPSASTSNHHSPTVSTSNPSYRYIFDMARTVEVLHDALKPLIRDLMLLGKHTPTTSEAYISANTNGNRQVELLNQRPLQEEPCNIGKLVDIKAVFDVVDGRTGLKGMKEADFLEIVSPVLCPTYPNRVKEWFCTVDSTESGFVDWRSLSAHLASRGLHLGEVLSREYKQLELATASSHDADADSTKPPLLFDDCPEGHLAPPTGFHVLKSFYRSAGRKRGFACLCDDGAVRCFDSDSMHKHSMLHYTDNPRHFQMAAMGISRERPHAYVADSSGTVLVYDTDLNCGRTGPLIKGYRLQSTHSVKPLTLSKTVKFDPLKMERPQQHMSNNRNPKSIKMDVELLPLQSPVDVTRHMITSIEGRCGGREPINFFVGWSEGTIASFSPELINPTTIAPTQVITGIHSMAVSCMQHHTRNVELRGLISASLDGSLCVTDLEKSTVKMRFANAPANANPLTTNNWSTTITSASTAGGGIGGGGGGGLGDTVMSNNTALGSTFNGGAGLFGVGGSLGATHSIRSLTQFDVSPNFPIIAAAGTQRYVTLWSGQSRRHLVTFGDHKEDVVSLHFNSVYELVTMGSDRTIRVYDIRTYKAVQVIRDKSRRYSGDRLTSMCVDGGDQSIVSWAGAPFTHRPVQGAVVLLAQGHPTTSTEIVRDESGVSISLVTNDVFEIHSADDGDTIFKYVSQKGPIKAVAHDDSWKRIFVLTDLALEVVIVGERKPTRVFEVAGYRLRTIGFLQGHGTTPSYIVGGNAHSIIFLSERNGSGVLQQEHNVVLSTLTKHKNSKHIEVVSAIACTSENGRVIVGTASGEVAVLDVTRNKVQVVFVFGADAQALAKTVAFMRRSKKYTEKGLKLWERAITASKRDAALGSKSFTDFKHERQGKLNLQCDSITLIGDTHCVIGFGSGEVVLAELSGEDSRFIARFPASFSMGIGCCFAYHDGFLACGDDEGYLTGFECDVHHRPTVTIEAANKDDMVGSASTAAGSPKLVGEGFRLEPSMSVGGGVGASMGQSMSTTARSGRVASILDPPISAHTTSSMGDPAGGIPLTAEGEGGVGVPVGALSMTLLSPTDASPLTAPKSRVGFGGRSSAGGVGNSTTTQTATSIRTEKFFLDCFVAMARVMHMPFAITALAMLEGKIIAGLDCGKIVAVCPTTFTFVWKGDLTIAPIEVVKTHQFVTYFGDATIIREKAGDGATVGVGGGNDSSTAASPSQQSMTYHSPRDGVGDHPALSVSRASPVGATLGVVGDSRNRLPTPMVEGFTSTTGGGYESAGHPPLLSSGAASPSQSYSQEPPPPPSQHLATAGASSTASSSSAASAGLPFPSPTTANSTSHTNAITRTASGRVSRSTSDTQPGAVSTIVTINRGSITSAAPQVFIRRTSSTLSQRSSTASGITHGASRQHNLIPTTAGGAKEGAIGGLLRDQPPEPIQTIRSLSNEKVPTSGGGGRASINDEHQGAGVFASGYSSEGTDSGSDDDEAGGTMPHRRHHHRTVSHTKSMDDQLSLASRMSTKRMLKPIQNITAASGGNGGDDNDEGPKKKAGRTLFSRPQSRAGGARAIGLTIAGMKKYREDRQRMREEEQAMEEAAAAAEAAKVAEVRKLHEAYASQQIVLGHVSPMHGDLQLATPTEQFPNIDIPPPSSGLFGRDEHPLSSIPTARGNTDGGGAAAGDRDDSRPPPSPDSSRAATLTAAGVGIRSPVRSPRIRHTSPMHQVIHDPILSAGPIMPSLDVDVGALGAVFAHTSGGGGGTARGAGSGNTSPNVNKGLGLDHPQHHPASNHQTPLYTPNILGDEKVSKLLGFTDLAIQSIPRYTPKVTQPFKAAPVNKCAPILHSERRVLERKAASAGVSRSGGGVGAGEASVATTPAVGSGARAASAGVTKSNATPAPEQQLGSRPISPSPQIDNSLLSAALQPPPPPVATLVINDIQHVLPPRPGTSLLQQKQSINVGIVGKPQKLAPMGGAAPPSSTTSGWGGGGVGGFFGAPASSPPPTRSTQRQGGGGDEDDGTFSPTTAALLSTGDPLNAGASMGQRPSEVGVGGMRWLSIETSYAPNTANMGAASTSNATTNSTAIGNNNNASMLDVGIRTGYSVMNAVNTSIGSTSAGGGTMRVGRANSSMSASVRRGSLGMSLRGGHPNNNTMTSTQNRQGEEVMRLMANRCAYMDELPTAAMLAEQAAKANNNHSSQAYQHPTSRIRTLLGKPPKRDNVEELEAEAEKNAKLLAQRSDVLPAATGRGKRGPTLCYQRLVLDRVSDPQQQAQQQGGVERAGARLAERSASQSSSIGLLKRRGRM